MSIDRVRSRLGLGLGLGLGVETGTIGYRRAAHRIVLEGDSRESRNDNGIRFAYAYTVCAVNFGAIRSRFTTHDVGEQSKVECCESVSRVPLDVGGRFFDQTFRHKFAFAMKNVRVIFVF